MAFSEFELKRYGKIVDAYVQSRRPPPNIRKELDFSFRFKNQSFEIFEVRPMWRSPGETVEHPVIKATYVKKRDIWRVYWQRADMKWHLYEPQPEVKRIEDVLEVAERDEYGCFYG